MGKDTHAVSGPAQRTALEVLAGQRRRDDHPARATASRRRRSSRGPSSFTTAAASRASRRRHRHHAVAQSARGWRLQVQSAQRRPGRHRRHQLDAGPGQRSARGRQPRRQAHALRRRPQGRHHAPAKITSCPTSRTWRNVIDMEAIRVGRAQDGRRSARRRRAAITGSRSRRCTSSTSRS